MTKVDRVIILPRNQYKVSRGFDGKCIEVDLTKHKEVKALGYTFRRKETASKSNPTKKAA